MNPFEQFGALYDRGLAVGDTLIHSDAMIFRWHDETFTFPLLAVHQWARFNGYFYTVPIDKLREMEREAAGGENIKSE